MEFHTIIKSLYYLMIPLITAYIIFYIFRFYSRLALYPRGPKPLPFIGNLHLLLANYNRHYSYLFRELAKNYGDLYTFWLGSKPVVIINEIETAKQAFNQIDCSDRIDPHIESQINHLLASGHKSFLTLNMNAEMQVLRKVSIEALRKFLSGNAMSEITHKIVDNTVRIMKSRELGKPFVPFKYIDSIVVRIIFEAIFNKPLDFENHKIDKILRYFEVLQTNTLKIVISEYIPVLKIFLNTSAMKTKADAYFNLIEKRFLKLKQSVSSSNHSDNNNCDDHNSNSLCVSHIIALNNIRSKDESKAKYLTESNIIGNLATLLAGGSDTSHYTFKWMLLFMAYYPEMQLRMRDEISSQIGDKVSDKCDREKCHFVNAFICETLRFRNVIPVCPPHMTSSRIIIANVVIPKGTIVLMNQISILNDHKFWKNPDMFIPERFLDSDQHFSSVKIPAFVPFGTGKRMCIGDKFAMNMSFLVLTRLLQSTDGMMFELYDKQNTDLEPKQFGFFFEPKPYKLRLVESKNTIKLNEM